MDDRKVTPISGSTELIDFAASDQPREIRIASSLSPDERSRLIDLHRSYLDVFAWSYEDMPGLNPSIVQHRLPILPHARPVKQKLRRLHPRWSLQVKEEIQKQLGVGFLSVVEYLEWLANVVHVPKKDSKILMAPKDMEKTFFITEWGTYCYWVMPFGLKNAGATYQRVATALFHDMMHRDVELRRLNPKKCTFGVTFGKLLGHIVSERGIEVDPEKIRAILDMPAPRIEKEIRGFLGRLQYITRFIARLTNICEPIFHLLRKNQLTIWDDDCQCAFEKVKEYLLSLLVLVPPTPRWPLLLYLSVSDMALGCMLAQLDDSRKELAIYYLKFEIRYVTYKSVLGSIVTDHLASLLVFDDRPIDDDFPDEQFVSVTSIAGWRLYFDGAANHSGFGIGILLISPHGDHIPRSVRLTFSDHHRLTNNIVEFDELRYIHLPRVENQFADALATLAFVSEIPTGVTMRPLLIETSSAPTYCCLIGDTEDQDKLPWYHDIYQFLACGTHPEASTAKDRRALRQLAT
ncbi:Retrovirus-related Pol polyprotein from transposon 17.6 [Vitis vinifera]|uniref:Retrovirus-related Pol polyprotein from transposon 17.6 n=1 Tax=Vitis vinifera TaxID=29760 RepID=A0A438FIQ1_VITVI|nr:Retrovirus-related Pol polyprotein from transposon 17.6 [Vitis vinifera]